MCNVVLGLGGMQPDLAHWRNPLFLRFQGFRTGSIAEPLNGSDKGSRKVLEIDGDEQPP